MNKKNILLTLSGLLFLGHTLSVSAELSVIRKQELQHLLIHDCGSCHGMTLKGGLGPSLLAVDLKNKSAALMFASISEGREGTPMPAWKSLLSAADINWIIKYLKNGIGNS